MRRALRIAGLVVLLLLVGCTAGPSPERRLQIACSSYADVLSRLAVRNRLGLLSGAAQDRIEDAVLVIAPVCEGDVPTEPGRVLDVVEAALIVMIEEANDRKSPAMAGPPSPLDLPLHADIGVLAQCR